MCNFQSPDHFLWAHLLMISVISCCITLPLGFFQDKVGVGEPSALHDNFTVCPIQEWDVAGATVSTIAASVKHNHATIKGYEYC